MLVRLSFGIFGIYYVFMYVIVRESLGFSVPGEQWYYNENKIDNQRDALFDYNESI